MVATTVAMTRAMEYLTSGIREMVMPVAMIKTMIKMKNTLGLL